MLSLNATRNYFDSISSRYSYVEEEDLVSHITVIHLPPSLLSSDLISPNLWSWIQDDKGGDIKIKAYTGQTLTFPSHLKPTLPNRDPISRTKTIGYNDGQMLIENRKVASRKPVCTSSETLMSVFNQDIKEGKPSGVPRLFISLSNIRLKSIVNASAVFCKVQIGSSQRFYTEVASCNHDINRGSYGISLRIDQGFIFDVPTDSDQVTINVQIFQSTASNDAESTFSRRKLHKFKSSVNTFIQNRLQKSTPSPASDLIGEFSIVQYTKPTKKISAPYNFKDKDGKKNIGKCLIILGVMNDIIYKAPIKFQISLQNSLDFYTRTSTFSVWKKYWCVLSNDYLQVYDQDFNSKVVGKILISDLKNVRISKDLCLDNILEFQVSTKFIPRQKLLGFDSAIEGLNTFARVPSKKAMSADEWDVSWKNGLIGHNLSNDSESLKIYLRAGSIVDLEEWRRSFEKLGVKSI